MANIENKNGFHTGPWIVDGIGALIGAAGIAATAAVLLLKCQKIHKVQKADQKDCPGGSRNKNHGRGHDIGRDKDHGKNPEKAPNVNPEKYLDKRLEKCLGKDPGRGSEKGLEKHPGKGREKGLEKRPGKGLKKGLGKHPGKGLDKDSNIDQPIKAIPHKQGFYEAYIKRPQDFCCALAAIIVLSPVMLVIALLVRIKLGSPVLFKQERPGLNGEIFTLYKFRSMTDERDADGNLLPDDIRLTKFGRLLRSTSLDELPELINMLKGDMAVVGPRPLLVQYLPLYNEEQARRHEVRPGFTGYAQVHGRNAITWEEKFEKDVYYVDHITFLGDWKIIFETILTVLKREGISSAGSATMEVFKGSSN